MPGQVRLGQSVADVKLCRTTMLTEDIAIRHARPHSTAPIRLAQLGSSDEPVSHTRE